MGGDDVEQLQVGQKPGVVAGKREANMAGIDGGRDDVLPALVEDRSRELRVLHGAHGEDDVIRGDRRTVGPAPIRPQRKRIAAPVWRDVPVRRQSSLHRPRGEHPNQRLEEQGIEIVRPGGGFAVERVERTELAHHALDVCSSRAGRLGRQHDAAKHQHQDRQQGEQRHPHPQGEEPATDQAGRRM